MSTDVNFAALGAIDINKTAIFVCDIQEKFRQVIANFDELTINAAKLIKASKILSVPLVVTEQYPKGLGLTVSELDVSNALAVVSKTKFTMWVPDVHAVIESYELLKEVHLETVVLLGIEAHVCVEQTAIDLVGRGYKVHIVADAVSSRFIDEKNLAFERLRQIGCFITTVETVLFKLIKDKEHPKFNEIRLLINKVPSFQT